MKPLKQPSKDNFKKFPSIHTPYKITSERGQPPYKGQSKSSLLYTLHTKYPLKEDNLSTKDKRQGPEHVHYSDVSL